jgi:hypothetical protein
MIASRASLAVLALAVAAAAQSAPCFENSFGTNIGAGDDTVLSNQALGFTFPGPSGPVTAIDISSNGFLWLGTNAINSSECCQGNTSLFLSENPRVAGYWMDLYPPGAPAGGGVFFNSIPAGGGFAARAVITWNLCPEYFSYPQITAQVQLVSTGEIIISHGAGNVAPQSFHQPVVGVTQGLGATANVVGFAQIPAGGVTTGSNPTAYQQYTIPPNYDLAGRTIWFLPNGAGGYVINQICSPPPPPPAAAWQTLGTGCPYPPVVYEDFPAGTIDLSNQSFRFIPNGQGGWVVLPGTGPFYAGFTNNIGAGDDTVTPGVALGFPFTTPSGTVNTIDIASNGFVWLATNGNSRCCTGNVPSLLSDSPCICPLWMDLYPPGAPAGGGVFADADPSGTAFYVTWNNVPEYFNTGSNTCQLAIFNNGQFELRYQSVANVNHECVVGYSTGNGSHDPGNRDLTALVPFSTGTGGLTLTLNAAPASLPILGTTFNQIVSNIPITAPIGFVILGFTSFAPAGVDLTGLGAPGCKQWQSIDADVLFFVAGSPTHTFGLAIPNNVVFAGTVIFTQGAVLSPGINPLGVISSNGGRMSVGV